MERTMKDVVDSLLQKGKITQDQYDSLNLEKLAAVSANSLIAKFGRGIKTFASEKLVPALGITSSALVAGALAKELVVDPVLNKLKTNESYQNLLAKTPQLADEDPERVRDYFNIVKEYSPHAAANPYVAGAIVNKMIQFGGVDHKLVEDMMSIQEKVPTIGALPVFIGAASKSIANSGDDK
jgi:hypothetical protein